MTKTLRNNEWLRDVYREFSRPQIAELLKLLKLDQIYVEARGDHLVYVDEDGPSGPERKTVLDLVGGYGATLLGHNHPALIRVVKEAHARARPTLVQGSIRKYSGLLALKINELVRRSFGQPEAFIVNLCNTGTEAVECALKHAAMQYQRRRKRAIEQLRHGRARLLSKRPDAPEVATLETWIARLEAAHPILLALQGSFHGKTTGALSATSNQTFSQMFDRGAFDVHFLDPRRVDECQATVARLIETTPIPGLPEFSPIIGLLFEPIQCEGGMEPLPEDFMAWMGEMRRLHGIPLIADEIQSGMFRTGRFLACEWNGLLPDYFLLGKSLGGGIAKITALAVRESMYQRGFSLVHSSTFAEDEISSLVALETFDVIASLEPDIAQRAQQFEVELASGIEELSSIIPGFIREVRGRGFLFGIEFDLAGERAAIPQFLKVIYDTGFGSYLLTSWLLNQAGIRVGVTLSRQEVIRVEPSAFITRADIDRFLAAMRRMLELLRDGKLVEFTRYLWRDEFSPEDRRMVSPAVKPLSEDERADTRTIAFVSHVIDHAHLARLDPLLACLSDSERARFSRKFSEVAGPFIYHEQIVRARTGARVRVVLVGTMRPTRFFESSLRAGDFKALEVVEDMTDTARSLGADLIGLGQYTSIVSVNGMLLDRCGVALTTGNSLTAGFAFKGLERELARSGRTLADVHIGVLGATGNICNVIAQLLADDVGAMTLVGRDGSAARLHEAADRIAANSRLPRERIEIAGDPSALRQCDGVLSGTSTSERILTPECFKERAVVIDISIPSNIDPRVYRERPDVRAFRGGFAELWGDQALETGWLALPRGQVYACLAETIALGLHGHRGNYSYGPLTKDKVTRMLEIAEETGVTLGKLLPAHGDGRQRGATDS